MKKYPAERGQPDDHGNRDRPDADPNGTGGLPRAFVGGDLAVAFLALPGRIGHGAAPATTMARQAKPCLSPPPRLQRERRNPKTPSPPPRPAATQKRRPRPAPPHRRPRPQ